MYFIFVVGEKHLVDDHASTTKLGMQMTLAPQHKNVVEPVGTTQLGFYVNLERITKFS
jgi:hypothetical protein